MEYKPWSYDVKISAPDATINVTPVIAEHKILFIIKHEKGLVAEKVVNGFLLVLLNKFPYLRFKEYYVDYTDIVTIKAYFCFDNLSPGLQEYVINIARSTLLMYHTKEEEIEKISIIKDSSTSSSLLVFISLNIGYDDETESYQIYKHKKFLEDRLSSSIRLDTYLKIS